MVAITIQLLQEAFIKHYSERQRQRQRKRKQGLRIVFLILSRDID